VSAARWRHGAGLLLLAGLSFPAAAQLFPPGLLSTDAPPVYRVRAHLALVARTPDGLLETRDAAGGAPVHVAADERVVLSAQADPPAFLWLVAADAAGGLSLLASAPPTVGPALLVPPPGRALPASARWWVLASATPWPALQNARQRGTGAVALCNDTSDPNCETLLHCLAAQDGAHLPQTRLAAGSVRAADNRRFPGVANSAQSAEATVVVDFRLVTGEEKPAEPEPTTP
jgi:hypothetical protein